MVFMGFYTFYMLKGLYLLFNRVYIRLKEELGVYIYTWDYKKTWLQKGRNQSYFLLEAISNGFDVSITLFFSFLCFDSNRSGGQSTLHGF